jgi:peptidoglycan/LPS O-acetylase OafA/YrhL
MFAFFEDRPPRVGEPGGRLIRNVAYPAIDGIRFYAAAAVAIEHMLGGLLLEYLHIPSGQLGYEAPHAAMRLVAYIADGNHGVDIFFIISGFLMARIVLGKGFTYWKFIRNRVMRIYPAFVISLCVAAIGDCLLFGWAWRPMDFIGDLFFLNAVPSLGIVPYNHVSWSLGYEFAFYLVIPVLCILTLRVDRRISGALLLIAGVILIPNGYIRFLALFAGAFIGTFDNNALRRLATHTPLIVAAVAYLSCGLSKAFLRIDIPRFDVTYVNYYYPFLIAASLLFIKIVFDENSCGSRFFASTPLRWLGTLSYSIYLYHPIVSSVVLHHLVPATPSALHIAWYFLASSAAVLAAAYLSYVLIERRYFVARIAPANLATA